MNFDMKNFQKEYYENIKPIEDEIKKEKKKAYLGIISVVVFILITLYIMNVFHFVEIGYMDYNSWLIYVALFLIIYTLNRIFREYTKKIKEKIFPVLLKSIDKDIEYYTYPKDFFPLLEYNSCGINLSQGTSCKSFNNIFINKEDKKTSIFELEVIKSGGKHSTTIFKGVLIKIETNKVFEKDIKITNNLFKDYGIFKTFIANSNKINLENIEFEKKYDVYCVDQVYARKVITLEFMEKVMYLSNSLKNQINFHFNGNTIYILIYGQKLIDDTTLFIKKISMYGIAKEIDNILDVVSVVDFLDASLNEQSINNEGEK